MTGTMTRTTTHTTPPSTTPTTRTSTSTTRPDYSAMAASGMTDMDIPSGNANLPGAMFLFAHSKLQAAKTQLELQTTWGRYARWWKKRLDREAWRLVEARCAKRSKELIEEAANAANGGGSAGQVQIEMPRTMGMRPPGGGDARVTRTTRMDAVGNVGIRGTETRQR